jgi:hypothetical protein
MSPPFTFLHLLLVIAGGFLLGLRVFRETQPKGVEETDDVRQLQRFATVAGVGLFLLIAALILGLDLGFFHTAKAIQ